MTANVPAVDRSEEARLARAAASAVRATEKRDRMIVESYEAGAGLREIARAVDMTHPGVRRIILRDRGSLDR